MLGVNLEVLAEHYRDVDGRISAAARRKHDQELLAEQEARLARERRRRERLESHHARQLERLLSDFVDALHVGIDLDRRRHPIEKIKQECVRGLTHMGRPMTAADIDGRCQKLNVARARQIAMVRCMRELNMSSAEVGTAFDRDHTTVIHAEKKLRREGVI